MVHIAMLALALCARPWNIDTSLYSILPTASSLKDVSEAEKRMSEQTMNQLNILVGHEDFQTARKAADWFDSALKDDSRLESVRYTISDGALEETANYTYRHRFSLLGDDYVQALTGTAGAQFARDEALQRIYGAFSLSDLSHLEEDPYLLGARAFDRFTVYSPLLSNKLSIKDSRLVANDSAKTYILWSARVHPDEKGIASEGHVLERVNAAIDSINMRYPGISVAKSGVPFHSFESSKNAQTEITWISAISITLALVLLIAVFRTPIPIASTLFSVFMAIVSALALTWSLFGEIHMFTLVFGTSIIGISIDYAIHFFTDWKFSSENPDGNGVRKRILKGILLGFMTTELGYIALSVAPFPLLRQMALFSATGLASALCTTLFLFQAFPKVTHVRAGRAPHLAASLSHMYDWYYRLRRPLKIALPVMLCALAVPGLIRLNVQTDLHNLYTVSDSLKKSETLANKVIDFGTSGSYYIVKGASAEDVLQKEESFIHKMEQGKKDSVFRNYLAVSYFVPSKKRQEESFAIIKQTLQGDAATFLKSQKFDNDSLFQKSLESFRPITPEDTFPSDWQTALQTLWLGEIDGAYYSTVLPLHVNDASALPGLANGCEGVYFVNKVPEISRSLTEISRILIVLVAITNLLMFAIFIPVYDLKTAFRIIRIPVCAGIAVASVFGLAGIDFNFFAIAGVILTLGIGIDYSLFFREGGGHVSTTALAIALSATTTILSFGSLSFSQFQPVYVFGLSIFIGTLTSFLLSPLTQKRK